MDDDTPLYSKVVDDQLAQIQKQIEDFHATHRASTFESDLILDGQREAIYNVRRKVLENGQGPLRERLVRYVEWIVDDACDAARIDGRRSIQSWQVDDLLEDLRSIFSSRRDQWLRESARETGVHPHFLPGVTAADIKKALLEKGDMPTGIKMPSLETPPELVAAAISGVDIVDMRSDFQKRKKKSASVSDTEPEASTREIQKRVEKRVRIWAFPKSATHCGGPITGDCLLIHMARKTNTFRCNNHRCSGKKAPRHLRTRRKTGE
jgi:preprotein translocase subunit SecA